MADNKEKLFTQFPPVSYDTWRAKVDADLKGVPFEKKLVWRTNEGFNVQPMYRREDIAELKTTDTLPGEFPYVRGTRCDSSLIRYVGEYAASVKGISPEEVFRQTAQNAKAVYQL